MARRIPASRRRRAEGDGANASARSALERAEAWRPWRAYAVLHLWKSLENANMTTLPAASPRRSAPLLATAARGALTGLYFEGGRHAPPISPGWLEDPRRAARCVTARGSSREYLEGKRAALRPAARGAEGTPFQQRVWIEIARIPYGEDADLRRARAPRGRAGRARAAGAATGRNPLSIIVPCHRVVGSHGSAHRLRGRARAQGSGSSRSRACSQPARM